MSEQLVVSQFAPGHPFASRNFPIRNRTMALLSDATVIVEAGEKSGTLHQGWEALRLGRLRFLMESVAKDPTLTWTAEMIRYGAQILSRENLEQCLDEIPALTADSGLADEARVRLLLRLLKARHVRGRAKVASNPEPSEGGQPSLDAAVRRPRRAAESRSRLLCGRRAWRTTSCLD